MGRSRFSRLRRPASLLLGLLVASAAGQAAEGNHPVHLSEVVTENRRSLLDEEGGRHGWVELHNTGPYTVSLRGWFLTDTRSNLTRWAFPPVSILPDKYLVIHASGRGTSREPAHVHANFRLNPESGYLALVNRATNVVSEFAPGYPALAPDVAFGSVRGEPGLRGRLGRPTPGRPNTVEGDGFAGAPRFSRPSGNFVEPFELTLSTEGSNAVIHYTTDGSLPTAASPAYGRPLAVTNSQHVRARVYAAGRLPGPVAAEAYLRLATNLTGFSSTLPLIVLDTLGQERPVSENRSFVRLSLHEPVHGRSSLTSAPVVATRAGYRVRGSTSAGMPQQGFAVELVDEFNQEKAQALAGLPADADWILYAPNAYDPVLLHNPFVHQLSREMGRYSPRTRFVEVFLVRGAGRVRPTHYHGLCVLEEKIKIGRHRVNLDRLGPNDLQPPAVTGGYVLKFDRLGPGESGFEAGGVSGAYVEPKEAVLDLPQRAAQRRYLDRYLEDFEQALYSRSWKDPVRGYRAYLDVEAAIDFHVLEVLSGNVDSLVLSTHFHKPRGGRIVFGPHWDFDRALGSTDGRDDNPRQWNTGPFFSTGWWAQLFRDPDFWQQWVDRWQTLRPTHFAQSNLFGLIDRLAAELRDAQPRQYERWGFEPRGGSYRSEIDWMKQWLASRLEFIDGQLVSPPRVTTHGDPAATGPSVTLATPPPATIYYTTDGSDPRAPQGGIASNAVAYAGPIALPKGKPLTARARDPQRRQVDGPPVSTPWSSPVTVTPAPGKGP